MKIGQVLKNREDFTLAIVESCSPVSFMDTFGIERRIRDYNEVISVMTTGDEAIEFTLDRDDEEENYVVSVVTEGTVLNDSFTIELDLENPTNKKLVKAIKKEHAYCLERKTIKQAGRGVKSPIVVTLDPVDITLDTKATAADMYAQVMNTVNTVSDEINANTKATDSKALNDAMTEGWDVLEQYADLDKKAKIEVNPSFLDKLTGKATKMKKEADDANAAVEEEMVTVKDHLDGLFGVLSAKKGKLLAVGDTAQRLLKTLEIQQDALLIVIAKTQEEKEEIQENMGYIPMSFQSKVNDIIASDTIVKDKITRANALISLVNAGMHSLEHVLPGIKAAISDESAYAALIDEVGDVTAFAGKMGTVLKDLANKNADQLHGKVENILDTAIEDTTVIDTAEDRFKKATDLNSMISDKTGKLGEKLLSISARTEEMAKLSTSVETTKQLKSFSS